MSNTRFKVIISALMFNLLINPLHAQLKDNGIYITSADFINKNLKMAFNKNEAIKYGHINKTSIVIKTTDSNTTFYNNDIWGYRQNEIPNSRTLDNFVVVLRKYFEKDPSNPEVIVSVRGVGYKFVG